MQTVTVQLTNQNALALLQKLEEMHIIKLLQNNTIPGQDIAAKYAGKLQGDVADEIQKYIAKSRKEWSTN